MKLTFQVVKSKAVEKLVDLWRRRDVEAIKEDLRKTGLVLIGGGLIGVIIRADTISLGEGLLLLVTGFTLWVRGILK